ncbi:MAG: hypothetical protein KJ041_06760, partial [Gammaproteobacteria bacterium]|nr:hypothetical protein [Gammaproteobacteria bacterium]
MPHRPIAAGELRTDPCIQDAVENGIGRHEGTQHEGREDDADDGLLTEQSCAQYLGEDASTDDIWRQPGKCPADLAQSRTGVRGPGIRPRQAAKDHDGQQAKEDVGHAPEPGIGEKDELQQQPEREQQQRLEGAHVIRRHQFGHDPPEQHDGHEA